jgi:hypothetical protein
VAPTRFTEEASYPRKRAQLLEAIAEHPIHSAQNTLIVARLSLDPLGPWKSRYGCIVTSCCPMAR